MSKTKLLTINGITHTLTEWARLKGIHPGSLWSRIKGGMSLEDAVNRGKTAKMNPIAKYEYMGKILTLQQWSAELGMKESTLYTRIKAGMPAKDVFSTSLASDAQTSRYEQVTINGECKTIEEWAGLVGVDVQTMKQRIAKGLSSEGLLAIPKTRPGRKITIDGISRTMTEWSKESGVSIKRISRRFYGGKRGKAIITPVLDNASYIEIGGVKKRQFEWAREHGISADTLMRRFKKGIRGKALLAPAYTLSNSKFVGKKYSLDGRSMTIPEWAKVLEVSPSTLYGRLWRKWPLREVLTTPITIKTKIRSNDTLLIDGVEKTIEEWSLLCGLKVRTIIYRMRRGLEGKQLLLPNPNHTAIEIDGQSKTFTEWARISGLAVSTIKNRYRRSGVRGRDLLIEGCAHSPESAKKYTCNGMTMTISQWSDKTGIKGCTIRERIRRGWTIERALTDPVSRRNKSDQ